MEAAREEMSVQSGLQRDQRTDSQLWLILGPSGVGKSCFGAWLASERSWLHLEADPPSRVDGIDLHGLRAEWDDFYRHGHAGALGDTLRRRLEDHSKTSVVLTLPSTVVLPPAQVAAAVEAGMRTICLYGSADHCVEAFVKREQRTGRNLTFDDWIRCNSRSYALMADPALAALRIHVFTSAGIRRSHVEVFEAIMPVGAPPQ